MGPSAHSANVQTPPSSMVQQKNLRDAMPSRGTWTSSRSGPMWTSKGSTTPSPAPGSGQPLQSTQAGGWRNWKQPCWGVLGSTVAWKPRHEVAMCTRSTEGQPSPGLHQKKCGWDSEQSGTVEDVPAHCRAVGLDGFQRPLPTQTILWFCGFMIFC